MKKKIGLHWLGEYHEKHPNPERIGKLFNPYKLAHIEGIIDEIETDGKEVNGLRLRLTYIFGLPLEHYMQGEMKNIYVEDISGSCRNCYRLEYITASFLDNESVSTLHASKGDDMVAVGAFDFRDVKDFEHYDFYIWEYGNKKTDMKIQFGTYNLTPEKIKPDLEEKYYHHYGRGLEKREIINNVAEPEKHPIGILEFLKLRKTGRRTLKI